MSVINISALSEQELRDLNHRIVARLKILHTARAQQAMVSMDVGQCMYFNSKQGIRVIGVVEGFGSKNVKLREEKPIAGRRWTVAASLLKPLP